ncbi:MAG TPA: bifunctional 23S rRNA (guanine(2069)-N(7))-methyltransferase RlmK/23S rRNA (guanine(2445)-N(2))-methyltransferase RlmL [Steroidobacteraceae bacterium]|nr:bifunctional 23S rRNA (guanine(2069)-N(7))-methyltransferase RlmK/23S rRNA (guanine(2445)-N(2))-methyltransferase RlmL [Steroidobacteraceae bacterium]
MTAALQLSTSCPRGLADLNARELIALGATDVRERSTGVMCLGTLETAYRACLWSRVANRILLTLARFEAADAAEFYQHARELDWSEHIAPGATLACDFSGRHPAITHTHFGALKLKDAICDQLRAQAGFRPDIARLRPSVRVHAHAIGAHITLALDLSGESLHRRGYRGSAGAAPLKENVAAGMLLRAGWPELAARGAPFLDPLCGSGTLVIEAALIAADMAPGRHRDYFGFLGWRGHDAPLWSALCAEADARVRAVAAAREPLRGQDNDPHAIRGARENAVRAGVAARVQLEVKALAQAAPLQPGVPGLLCTNPPYGVRLSDRESARTLHRELGRVLREHFEGWDAAILTGAPELGMELGIRAHRTHALWNGALECRLLRLTVAPESLREPGHLSRTNLAETAGARMFANRLAKNLKRLQGWAERTGISCYRLYDADMPEYAFAIDRYQSIEPPRTWLYVQEYAAPAEIERDAVRRRRGEVLATLPAALDVPAERVRLRTRRRMRRGEQYIKAGPSKTRDAECDGQPGQTGPLVVEEGGLRFEVNFDEYLDTGLFLDHRLTRARLRALAAGQRFLNLYAYTGSATVYAAAGGALASTSVDLSRTYLQWAQRNLALNALSRAEHRLVQADCREWLAEAARAGERYQLVFLDPPTFSNSKRMRGVLDIQRDHAALIDATARVCAPEGVILFATNAQRFRLDTTLAERYDIRDTSAATLPLDFERNPRIHRCFELRPRR